MAYASVFKTWNRVVSFGVLPPLMLLLPFT
jgi:hypothetical protein